MITYNQMLRFTLNKNRGVLYVTGDEKSLHVGYNRHTKMGEAIWANSNGERTVIVDFVLAHLGITCKVEDGFPIVTFELRQR